MCASKADPQTRKFCLSLLFIAVWAIALLVLWGDVELREGLENPSRNGFNAQNCVILLLAYFFTQRAILLILPRYSAVVDAMSYEKQTKVITYIMELLFSTAYLGAIIAEVVNIYIIRPDGCTVNFTNDMALLYQDCTTENLYFLTGSWTCVIMLYLFEACMQQNMRHSLLMHHLAAVSLLFVVLLLPPNTTMIMIGNCQVLFAVLEQPTFAALLCFRLFPERRETAGKMMTVAWISFGLTKLASHVWSFYYFVKYYDTLSTKFVGFYIFFVTLFIISQVYSTWAQRCIAVRFSKKCNKEGNVKQDESATKETVTVPEDDIESRCITDKK